MEGARFLTVSVAGLLLDITVAWCAVRFLGVPLWLATTTGFCIASAMNYVLHELWTFRGGVRRLSTGRALRYVLTASLALVARVAAVSALAAIFGANFVLAALVGGAGVSLWVNYLLSRYLVFRQNAVGGKDLIG